MRERTEKKLDTIAFAGGSLARIGYLVWYVATLPG